MLDDGLVGRIVELAEVGVLQGVLYGDALVGVEGEQLVEEVQSERLGFGVEASPGDSRPVRQTLEVGPGFLVEDAVEIVLRRRPYHS